MTKQAKAGKRPFLSTGPAVRVKTLHEGEPQDDLFDSALKTVYDCPLVGLIMIVIGLDLELGARYLPIDFFFLKGFVFNIQFFIFHIGFFSD